MYHIAVCDDERSQAELLRGYVEDWAARRRESVDIGLFPSGDAFLFAWEDDKAWDALLLDIQMEGINGMDMARRLREQRCHIPIVFVTGVPDYMEEGYEVEALHYLMKPVSREKLFACLDRAVEKSSRDESLLLDLADGQTLRILPRDIALLEASGHRTQVLLYSGERLEVKGNFRGICAQLPPREFVQSHRSYMVGLRHILRLQKDCVTLDSGQRVPVSRRLFEQVNHAFVHFYRQGD